MTREITTPEGVEPKVNEDLINEIDDMIGGLDSPAEEVQDEGEADPGISEEGDENLEVDEEAEGEEAGGEIASEEDAELEGEREEAPAGDEAEGEAVVDESVSELAQLKAQNEALLKMIEGEDITVPASAPVAEPDAPVEEPAAAPAFVPVGEGDGVDFLGGLDIDDVASDPRLFNEVMNKAVQIGETRAAERMLRAIPELVTRQIKQQTGIQRTVDAFYKDNADLRVVKKTVGKVANQVAAEHPDWKLSDVFGETATRTRTLLGIRKQVVDQSNAEETGTKTTPAFVKRPGQSPRNSPKPKLNKLQKEINDLIA